MAVNRVIVDIFAHGVDHEPIGSNETEDFSLRAKTLLGNSDPQNVFNRFGLHWGGECRLEVTVDVRRLDDADRAVEVTWLGVLFEGATDQSDDEDGRAGGTFIVPFADSKEDSERIVNLDEGGDFADFRIAVTNLNFS
jgi:hypothetical protein